jgi:hypothetical protein
MRLEFNRLAEADIFRILEYYEGIGGPKLADEFYGTTADDRRSGFDVAKKTAGEIVDHFARQRALAEGANAA